MDARLPDWVTWRIFGKLKNLYSTFSLDPRFRGDDTTNFVIPVPYVIPAKAGIQTNRDKLQRESSSRGKLQRESKRGRLMDTRTNFPHNRGSWCGNNFYRIFNLSFKENYAAFAAQFFKINI